MTESQRVGISIDHQLDRGILDIPDTQATALVLELDLVGHVKFISKSWRRIVGTEPSKILKRPIADIIIGEHDDKMVFNKATDSMILDDETYRIRFIVETNLENVSSSDKESDEDNDLVSSKSNDLEDDAASVYSGASTMTTDGNFIELDAQGILIHDKEGQPSHTMWIVKPWTSLKEVTLEMPEELIGTLGFGVNLLESYLHYLMELEVTEEINLPPPSMELCRICEQKVPNWWLEKHTELCVVEHRVQDMVYIKQEELQEHQILLHNILDTLNKRKHITQPPPSIQQSPQLNVISPTSSFSSQGSKPSSGSSLSSLSDSSLNSVLVTEYKGLPIPMGPQNQDSVAVSRRRSTSSSLLPQFRFPFKNIEQLISYCDEALIINPGEIKIGSKSNSPNLKFNLNFNSNLNSNIEQQEVAYSPNSARALKNIRELKLPTSSDPAINELTEDTLQLVEDKLESLRRYAHILQYVNRIERETDQMITEVVSNIVQQIKSQVFSHYEGDTTEIGIETTESPRASFSERLIRPESVTSIPNEFLYGERSRSQSPMSIRRAKSPLGVSSLITNVPKTPSSNPSQLFSNSYVCSDHNRSTSREELIFSGATVSTKTPKDPLVNRSRSGSTTPGAGTPRASSSSLRAVIMNNNSTVFPSGASESRVESRSNSSNRQPTLLTPIAMHSLMSSSDELAQRIKRHSDSTTPIRAPSPTFISNVNGNSYPLPLSSIQRTTARGRSDSAANSIAGGNSSSFASPLISPLLAVTDSVNKQITSTPNASNLSQASNHHFLKLPSSQSSQVHPPLSPLLLAQGGSKLPHSASIKNYEPVKPISKGAFGSVFLAKKKTTGDYVAIKVLKKLDMIAKNQVLNVKAERAIMMAQEDSPYVVQLLESFQSPNYLYLVMEYLNGGDLATLLKNIGSLPDAWAKRYIAEVIIEVEDLHSKGIIHRDLKPDNLLIDNKGHVRLTDFGLSRMGLVNRQKAISAVMSGNPRRSSSLTSTPTSSDRGSFSFPSTNVQAIDNPFKSFGLNESGLKHLPQVTPFSLNGQQSDSYELQDQALGSVLQIEYKTRARTLSNASDISMRSSPVMRPKQLSIANSLISSTDESSLRKLSTSSTTENERDKDSPRAYALFDPSHSSPIKKFVGTPDYLAPETIAGVGQDKGSDWWSIGCILFEFLFGYPPFNDETPERVFDNILNHDIQWPNLGLEDFKLYCSDEARDLILKLLVKNPIKRLGSNGSEEIKKHPYFNGVHWETLFTEEASFVPSVDNPESTDYFDQRGADMSTFPTDGTSDEEDEVDEDYEDAKEHDTKINKPNVTYPVSKFLPGELFNVSSDMESTEDPDEEDNTYALENDKPMTPSYRVIARSNSSSSSATTTTEFPRPSLSLKGNQLGGSRDRRGSRLNDLNPSEFGNFQFRNISVLEKQNKDAINRLKNEHYEHSHRGSMSSVGSLEYFGLQTASSGSGNNSTPVTPVNTQFSNVTPNAGTGNSGGGKLKSFHSASFSSKSSPTSLNAEKSIGGSSNMNFSPNVKVWNESDKKVSTSSAVRVFTRSQKSLSQDFSSGSDTDDGFKLNKKRGFSRKSSKPFNLLSTGFDQFRNLDLNILVCEPIPIHRFSIAKDLKEMGFNVVTCGTGSELIKRTSSSKHYDVIFTSTNLQKLDAIDLVKLIRHTNGVNSESIVVVMTGWSKEFENSDLIDYVVECPVTSVKLRNVIQKVVEAVRCNDEEAIVTDTE